MWQERHTGVKLNISIRKGEDCSSEKLYIGDKTYPRDKEHIFEQTI